MGGYLSMLPLCYLNVTIMLRHAKPPVIDSLHMIPLYKWMRMSYQLWERTGKRKLSLMNVAMERSLNNKYSTQKAYSPVLLKIWYAVQAATVYIPEVLTSFCHRIRKKFQPQHLFFFSSSSSLPPFPLFLLLFLLSVCVFSKFCHVHV